MLGGVLFHTVLALLSSMYVAFKGHARCLPCAGLACTECCVLLLECVLVVPHGVARAVDSYRVVAELVSWGEGWMCIELYLWVKQA